jgi:hypothetical protein
VEFKFIFNKKDTIMVALRLVILLMAFVIFMLTFAKAEEKFIWSCHYWSGDTTPTYVNCVNNNFREVKRRFFRHGQNVNLWFCSNFGPGNELLPSFVSCTNNNFRNISYVVRDARFWHCFNNFSDGVSYSFESCVNSNFDEIDRFLPF